MFQINFSFKLIVTSAFAFQVIKINHAKQSLSKKKKNKLKKSLKSLAFYYYFFPNKKQKYIVLRLHNM